MIKKGEKCVLYLLDINNSKISKLRLVKLMFLISEQIHLYDFIPYKYGPFSFQLYHDLSRLEKCNLISIKNNSVSLVGRNQTQLDTKTKKIIRAYSRKFADFDDKYLLDYIYDKYPEYTILSYYKKLIEFDGESSGLVTIGYEGKSIDSFLNELIINKISVVIDVRRNAYSMKFGFSDRKLRDYLDKINIEYIHMADLGIPSDLRKDLVTHDDYQSLFVEYAKELDDKQDLLKFIEDIGANKKAALMCFEKDVNYCHRSVIAEKLRADDIKVIDL
jgi:uncharacterized protein (DUF488 family)